MKIECCHKCAQRHTYCHVSCKEYIKQREALTEYNRKLRKERREMQATLKTMNYGFAPTLTYRKSVSIGFTYKHK